MRSVLVAVMLGTLACGGGDAELQRLRREKRDLEATRDLLRLEVATRQQVLKLQPGSVGAGVLSPAELAAGYTSVMPLEFDASILAKEVGGHVVVEGVKDARVDGNRLFFTLYGRGRDIHATVNVPVFLQQMVNDLIAGVQAGLELRAAGHLVARGGGVEFVGRCEGAQLARNGNDNYHNIIVNQVNDRLMNRSWPIAVAAGRQGVGGWSQRGVLAWGGNVVVLAGTDAAPQPAPHAWAQPQPAPAPPPSSPAPQAQPQPAPAPPPQQSGGSVGTSTQVPPMAELVRQCSQVMEQLWRCREQGVDMLLEERARFSTQVSNMLKDPQKRANLRTYALRGLDQKGGGNDAQRKAQCQAALGNVKAASYVDFRAAGACWDKPCATRVACLRPFVTAAIPTDAGLWLR